MALTVATNVSSLNTQRWLGISSAGQSSAVARLSSGFKINKAADDASGIAIALKLNVKAASVSKAIDNGNQAIAMLQTAESGVEQIANILTRMKELATQAASSNTDTTGRANLEAERAKLEAEIDRIANGTKYGDQQLLVGNPVSSQATIDLTNGGDLGTANGIIRITANGDVDDTFNLDVEINTAGDIGTLTLTRTSDGAKEAVAVNIPTSAYETVQANFSNFGVQIVVNEDLAALDSSSDDAEFVVTPGAAAPTQLTFQVGDLDDANNQITFDLIGYTALDLGIDTLSGDISTQGDAQTYLGLVDSAVDALNQGRASIGAAQNSLSYHVANLESTYENAQAAESTIKDADYAKEMADYTKYQITVQAGVAMLAQANQIPQAILTLLRG